MSRVAAPSAAAVAPHGAAEALPPPSRADAAHPLRVLGWLGIGDSAFMAVVVVAAALAFHVQVAYFLALTRLSLQFDGMRWPDVFLNRWMLPALIPPMALAGAWWRERRRRARSAAAAGGGVELSPSSGPAGAVLADRDWLAARAALPARPAVRRQRGVPFARVERGPAGPRIAVGLKLLGLYQRDPSAARAVLAHEVSHVEAHDMSLIAALRNGAWLYLTAVTSVGLAGVGLFLLRRYELFWDDSITALAGRLNFCCAAALVPFLYVRQFLVQREYLHDRRAGELVGDGGRSLMGVLAEIDANDRGNKGPLDASTRWARHFLRFHPLPRQRVRALRQAHPVVIDPFAYPYLAGMLLPLMSVGIFFLGTDLPTRWTRWRGGLAVTLVGDLTFAGLTLAMFAPDAARFAASVAVRRFRWRTVVAYVAMVAAGTFSAAVPVLALPSSNPDPRAGADLAHLLAGLAWAAVAQAGLILALTYVWAVDLVGGVAHVGRRRMASALRWPLAFPLVLCFQALSSSRGFHGAPLAAWTCITALCATAAALLPRMLRLGARAALRGTELRRALLLIDRPVALSAPPEPVAQRAMAPRRARATLAWVAVVACFAVPVVFEWPRAASQRRCWRVVTFDAGGGPGRR